jgi:antitoxin StbD
MHQIHAEYSTSITDLKRNPAAILDQADGEPIAILSHNKPVAYLIPSETYELMLEKLEDRELIEIALSRIDEYNKAITVNIDEI